MATILLQAAGAYLGGMLGSFGAVVGTAAGALAGYAVDRMLLNGTNTLEGPRLGGPRPFSAEEGVPIPRVYGTARVGGTMIWATRFSEKRTSTRQGKTGPKVNQYFYYANAAFLLCASAGYGPMASNWIVRQSICGFTPAPKISCRTRSSRPSKVPAIHPPIVALPMSYSTGFRSANTATAFRNCSSR